MNSIGISQTRTTPKQRSALRSSICSEVLLAGIRGDIVQEIHAIVRDVANGQPGWPDPLDDDMPGG